MSGKCSGSLVVPVDPDRPMRLARFTGNATRVRGRLSNHHTAARTALIAVTDQPASLGRLYAGPAKRPSPALTHSTNGKRPRSRLPAQRFARTTRAD